MEEKDMLLAETDVGGTAGISFHATAEHGDFVEIEELENSGNQNFTRNDFEKGPEEVSRRVKK